MTTAIVHLMQGDVDGLVDDAISLGFLPVCVERTGVVWWCGVRMRVCKYCVVLQRGEVCGSGVSSLVFCLAYSPIRDQLVHMILRRDVLLFVVLSFPDHRD